VAGMTPAVLPSRFLEIVASDKAGHYHDANY